MSSKVLSLVVLGLVITMAPGCSDPTTSRLDPGTHGTIVDPNNENVPGKTESGQPSIYQQGASVVVISDVHNAAITDHPDRPVKITIKDGIDNGATITVARRLIKVK